MKNGTQAKIGATPGRKVYAVDLFCGAGGLTHGLVKAGVDVRLGVDIDPACEHPYVANNNAGSSSNRWRAGSQRVGPLQKERDQTPGRLRSVSTFSTTTRRRRSPTNAGGSVAFRDSWTNCLGSGDYGERSATDRQNVFDEFVANLEAMGTRSHTGSSAPIRRPQQRNRLVLLASSSGRSHF